MAYWLLKTEPGEWSWDDQRRTEREHWDGVRNHQATRNLKSMKQGDEAFFYHSGKDPSIVGIVEVVREFYPDAADASGKFGMVDVKAVSPLKRPVSLKRIKAAAALGDMFLVRQPRLSVGPVTPEQWRLILAMSEEQ